MFNPEKLSKEIIETFNSLEEEEQKRILSNCGLSFQKKQIPSTNSIIIPQYSTKKIPKSSVNRASKREKELVNC